MKVLLLDNVFGYKKGTTIDIAHNMAHHFIACGRARLPDVPGMTSSTKKKRKVAARKKTRKRAASPSNKMASVSNDK